MKTDKGIPKKIQDRASELVARAASGGTVRDLKGQRLQHDRTVVSVPVGRRYRLLFEDTGDGLVAKRLCSHEKYNGTKPR